MFKGASKPVVGLDIGADSVKMVGLKKNGLGFHVTGAAISSIEPEDASPASRQTATISAINRCLKEVGNAASRKSHFVCGLSWPDVKVSSFNFASLAAEEVDQAVNFEATQVCSFDIRNCIVDYHLIDADGGVRTLKKKKVHENVKGVLAVATREAVETKRKIARDASLKCVLIDSDGLALLNCLTESLGENAQMPAAIVNVGNSVSTMAILGEDGLPFIRDLAFSGRDIINNIAQGTGIDAGEVDRSIRSGQLSPELSASIRTSSKRLIRDINETLSYYSSRNGNKRVEHLYVSGGFSLVDDFIKAMNDGVRGKASVWNPFTHLHCQAQVADTGLLQKHGPALAVAAGLAMRSI